jgi:hypothetical protein
MSQPKFRVGEEVIIKTRHYPQIDGQVHRIVGILDIEEANARNVILGINQGIMLLGSYHRHSEVEFFYVLDGLWYEIVAGEVGGSESFSTGAFTDTIHEFSLSRYHRPADTSFSRLMATFGSAVTA